MLVKVPSWHYADAALPAGATSLPLRDALARCYDLRQPKPELLQLLHSKLQAAAAGSGVAANGHAAAENGSAANGTHAANGTAKAGGKKKGGKGKARQQQNGQQNGQQRQQQNGGSAAAHDDLCSQGCVVDKLEVGHSAGLLFFWSVHWLDVPAVVSESFGWPHPENELLADWRHNRKTSGTYCPGLPPLPSFLPQRLEALTADTAAAEAYLAPRHVIDVLRDFRLPAGATLGPAELLGTLRQLQPRLYSISSSQVGGLVHSCRQDCAHSCRDMQRCHWLRVHGCSCADLQLAGAVLLPPTVVCCLSPPPAVSHHLLLPPRPLCSWSTPPGCRPPWQSSGADPAAAVVGRGTLAEVLGSVQRSRLFVGTKRWARAAWPRALCPLRFSHTCLIARLCTLPACAATRRLVLAVWACAPPIWASGWSRGRRCRSTSTRTPTSGGFKLSDWLGNSLNICLSGS